MSSSAEQKKILLEVTQVIATKWEDTMDMELEDIQGMDPSDSNYSYSSGVNWSEPKNH